MYYKGRKPSPSSECCFHHLEGPDEQLQIMQLPALGSNYFKLKVKSPFPEKISILQLRKGQGEVDRLIGSFLAGTTGSSS